jgi:tetratricopeptide (TPR) repeat protein
LLKNKFLSLALHGVLLGLLWTDSAQADFFSSRDNATRGPELLKWDPSARSAGMGGAYVSVADDMGALYWNPAGLQQLDRPDLQLSHTRVFGDQSVSVAGVGWPTWRAGHRETWGIGVTYLAMDPFDVVSENNAVGQARVSEGVASLAYARPLGSVQVGVAAKYIRQDLYVVQGQTYALDVGLFQESENKRWSWGIAAANMGPALTLGNKDIGLPLVIRTGVRGLFSQGTHGKWLVSLQGDAPIDDQVQGHAGVEYQTVLGGEWRAALRGGIQTQEALGQWALGASLERGALALHYTFSENEDLGAVNRFELALKFGSPLAQETERHTLINQARASLQTGDIPLAQDSLDRLKTLSPRDREAEKLRQTLRAAVWETLDPVTLLQQGQQAVTAGDLDAAASFFRKLLAVQPEHREGTAALAHVENTIAARQLAQTRQHVIRQRTNRINKLVGLARQNMGARQWDAAIPRWREVLALDRHYTEAKNGIVTCRKSIYEEAITAQKSGDTERARHLFLKLHAAGGPLEDSERRLNGINNATKEKARKRSAAAYQEGREAYRQGELVKAQTLFQEALKGQPNDKAIQRALERVEEELDRRRTP